MSSLVFDLLLVAGILLLLLSPFRKFKEQRKVLIFLGVLLVIVGIIFIDWNAARDAFWEGYNATRNTNS